MTDEEQYKSIFRETFDEYIKPSAVPFPGVKGVELAKPVRLAWFNATLKAGLYFVVANQDGEAGEHGFHPLYVARFDGEGEVDEQTGELVNINDIKVRMERLRVDGKEMGIKGMEDVLTLEELTTWAAAGVAIAKGDNALAEKVLRQRYKINDKPIEGGAEHNAVELPRMDTTRPRSHVQPISKLSQKITEVGLTGDKFNLIVSGKNEAKAFTCISLVYAGDEMTLSRSITAYDRIVHNAVATLWNAGNRTITVAQVYRAMTGSKAKKITEAQLARVEESLDKQRLTLVSLDFSEELRGRTGEYDGEQITADKAKAETYMLNATKTFVDTTNGRRAVGYIINEAPVLYWHAKITKQIITYPQRLLEETSKKIGNKETDLLIRDYLLQRIKPMGRKGSKVPKQIKFKTVYDNIGASVGTNRAEVKRLNDRIKRCLDALKDLGVILKYEEYKDGRSHKLVGVTVEVPEAQN